MDRGAKNHGFSGASRNEDGKRTEGLTPEGGTGGGMWPYAEAMSCPTKLDCPSRALPCLASPPGGGKREREREAAMVGKGPSAELIKV